MSPTDPAVQRVLEAAARKGVTLDVRVADVTTHTAAEAAAAVGADLGQIVKSLVFVIPGRGDEGEAVVCLVSGIDRVDIARLAAVTAAPDIRRATASEARTLTGFSIGGIPPFGHPRPLRVYMDSDLSRYATVWAAAGTDRAVFPVPPATLAVLSNAVVAPIAEDRRSLPQGDRDAAGSPAAAQRAGG